MSKVFGLVLLSFGFLFACAPGKSNVDVANEYWSTDFDVPEQWPKSSLENSPVEGDWLVQFSDPVLEGYVNEARTNNPGLKGSIAVAKRAKSFAAKATGGLFPSIDMSFNRSRVTEVESGLITDAIDSGLDVSWEADLFGRNRSLRRSAWFEAEATEAELEAADRQLVVEVSEAYFLAIESKLLELVERRNFDALSETLKYVSVQYDRGLRSGQDLALIRTDVANAEAAVVSAANAARNATRRLESLIGRYPGATLVSPDELPSVPEVPSAGIPIDLLNKRPDIAAAARRYDAAIANKKSAVAATLPAIRLSGYFGSSTDSFANLFEPSTLIKSVSGGLLVPIFEGGRLRAEVDVAAANIDFALARYRETAIAAFLEVEDQLDQSQALKLRQEHLMMAHKEAVDALKFAKFRYETGDSDLLNVLSIQQRVFSIEGRLVSMHRARLVQFAELAFALGGSP